MDEFRNRHAPFGRQAPHQAEPPPGQPAEPCLEQEARHGFLPGFALGFDWLEDYFPILLILLVAVGLYFWLGKQGGGLGGLLGGFLK